MTVWSVFLSSTVKDFEEFRREVKSALDEKAETACFLSEDWVGGFDDTVAKCKANVERADAFLLLLGYWYGSIPPGSARSITHLEFDWALKRWELKKFPPLAVMMPKPGSDADTKLRAAAQRLLRDKTTQDREEHEQRLAALHNQATQAAVKWRTFVTFKDQHELRENVIVNSFQWRGYTPFAAARGELAGDLSERASVQVSDDQLGRLGRKKQFDAVRDVLAQVADHADVPALAVIVHGDEDAGQRAFLLRLVNSTLKEYFPRSRVGRLPLGENTLAMTSAWIAAALGIGGAGVQAPAELADRVAVELKRQPLYFVLDRIADFPGGAAAFRDAFWVPFAARLRELRAAQQFDHRLVGIVVDYAADDSAWRAAAVAADPDDAQPDYTKLIAIPRLGPLKRSEVLSWLQEVDVPDNPPGRRAQLADRATKGNTDLLPIRVFERLRGETLWPEGDDQ